MFLYKYFYNPSSAKDRTLFITKTLQIVVSRSAFIAAFVALITCDGFVSAAWSALKEVCGCAFTEPTVLPEGGIFQMTIVPRPRRMRDVERDQKPGVLLEGSGALTS